MKVSFFHLMPYQDLPDDFAEQHHSAWVDLPNENFDPAKGNEYYAQYIDQLRYADEVGFDGICVNEHHNNAYGIMPSPNLIASVLANSTNNGAVIVLGNSLALYNPPVRVAEEMAMIDVISGGRLVAGFPVGTSMDTTFSYGQVPITLRDRHTEAHDVVMQAWTQHHPTIFNGKYNKLRYISIWPRPMQEPHPPVWVPGSGSLETWDWVLDRDYVYCYLSYYGYLRGHNIVKGYWDRVAERGIDDNPHRLGFLQLVCVSETDEQAEKDYEEHVKYFYEKMLRVYPPFAESPGYRSLDSIRKSLRPQMGEEAQRAATENSWKDYIAQGHVIGGSPETVRKKLTEACELLRIGHLMVLLQIGSMPPELVKKNTDLFANEVMPHMKGLFNEYDDPWWPEKLKSEAAETVGD